MSLATRSIATAGLTAGLLMGTAALASADTSHDLAGHWNSASLRMDGVGYSLSLTDASDPSGAYDGVLLFHFQNGRLGPKIKVGVAQSGHKVTLVMPGGSLASGNKTLSGTIGQDGSITFAHCQRQFAYVTKATADSMCMFQEFSAGQ